MRDRGGRRSGELPVVAIGPASRRRRARGSMATAPGLNERPVLHWWRRSFPDSRAAQVALKDQQKMAPVNHTHWESTLPLTLSLSDSGNLFCPLRASAARANTISFYA